jgi:hypothetical protein
VKFGESYILIIVDSSFKRKDLSVAKEACVFRIIIERTKGLRAAVSSEPVTVNYFKPKVDCTNTKQSLKLFSYL